MTELFIASTVLILFFLGVATYNLFTAPVFKAVPVHETNPFISVLIPARNEEENLYGCIDALINQSYKNFEVIIGDDNSEDRTSEIAANFSSRYPNLVNKIIIPELPPGWLGKNHAAYNLAEEARGEYLLFIDADVMLEKEALSSAVFYAFRHNADLVSVFPTQRMKTAGEKIVVPLLNFFLLSLLPLKQVFSSRRKEFTAAIGQFMMFRREAYFAIGGHESVKGKIAEDLALASATKKIGFKVLTMIDGGLISCRMYHGIGDAVNGFTKNFFKGSTLPLPVFLITLTMFFLIFFFPFAALMFNSIFIIPVLIILILRGIITLKSAQNFFNIFLHPLQIIVFYFIGIRSLSGGKNVTWKGRDI